MSNHTQIGAAVLTAFLLLSPSVLAGAGPAKVHLLVSHVGAQPAQSLKVLWPARLTVHAVKAGGSLPDIVIEPGKAVVIALVEPGSGVPLQPLRKWAEAGATVVLDLPLFAAVVGGVTHDRRLEDRNHLPFDPQDIKPIEEAGTEFSQYLQRKGKLSEKTLAVRAALRAEVAEPIPSIRVTADDPALRGFARGDVVPWCGHRRIDRPGRWGEYHYRTRTRVPEGVRVLAVSAVTDEPAMATVTAGKGTLYGIDLGSLDEPCEKWDRRGSFHKYISISNLAGPGVRAGCYWTRKPAYAEFVQRTEAFAAGHPEWKLDTVGRRRNDPIHRLTLGDSAKPAYVFIGMSHAEDEWVPALGSLAFAELLSRRRADPEAQARLEKFCVKIYPLIHPAIYESPLTEPGQPVDPDVFDRAKNRDDKCYSITTLHQGGDVVVPACGTPLELAREIAERARDNFAGRHVWWYYVPRAGGLGYGPQVWESRAPAAALPPSWSVYWWQGGRTSCYGLYDHEEAFAAKAMHFIEQEMLFLVPERFSQAPHHHALHRMLFEHTAVASLVQSDQTANWCMAVFMTEHRGRDRDHAWRPER